MVYLNIPTIPPRSHLGEWVGWYKIPRAAYPRLQVGFLVCFFGERSPPDPQDVPFVCRIWWRCCCCSYFRNVLPRQCLSYYNPQSAVMITLTPYLGRYISCTSTNTCNMPCRSSEDGMERGICFFMGSSGWCLNNRREWSTSSYKYIQQVRTQYCRGAIWVNGAQDNIPP